MMSLQAPKISLSMVQLIHITHMIYDIYPEYWDTDLGDSIRCTSSGDRDVAGSIPAGEHSFVETVYKYWLAA